MRSLLERASATGNGTRAEPRSLDEVLPERGDVARHRDMETTWRAFCLERYGMVRAALESRRTPPEIAYQLGELVHTYFRPRGLTLTSHELRRLVAELLAPPKSAAAAPAIPHEPTPPIPPVPAPEASDLGSNGEPAGLVTFASTPTPAAQASSWTGDEQPSSPAVSEEAFELPASPLVSVTDREAFDFDRLLARTLELVKPRLATATGQVRRDEALRAIEAAVDEVLRMERQQPVAPQVRQRLLLVALSETSGLGLIDRLWADHSIRTVFVNGPKAVFVERDGGLAPAAETFRDQAHLLELVGRLTDKPASGVAEFRLRDGSSGTVIFPPTAPDGPVLTIRRAESGTATLDRLIAAGLLDQKIAALLRAAVRARLTILVTGPAGSGKTALLAALARDLDATTRIVTVARHREFRWTAPAKVELVVSTETPYEALLGAGAQLRPDVLVLDSLRGPEMNAIGALAAHDGRGIVAACEPDVAASADFARTADLVVRLDRGRDGLFRAVSLTDVSGTAIFVYDDGRFRCRAAEPAFGEKLRAAGYGELLSAVLR